MRILVHRQREPGLVAGGAPVAVIAFHDAPAVVLLAGAFGLEVDLFPLVLPDVGDVQVAGAAIEAEAPWVAQAPVPDQPGLIAGQRGGRCVLVEPQDLAQIGGQALARLEGISAAAAVANAGVQIAIRTEDQHAAVVVRIGGVPDLDQFLHLRGARHVGVAAGDLVLRDHDVTDRARALRVVDEEAPVAGVLRVEGQTEQAALAARRHDARDVEEGRGHIGAVLDDADLPRLAHHEQTRGVPGGRGDVDRSAADAGADVGELERGRCRSAGGSAGPTSSAGRAAGSTGRAAGPTGRAAGSAGRAAGSARRAAGSTGRAAGSTGRAARPTRRAAGSARRAAAARGAAAAAARCAAAARGPTAAAAHGASRSADRATAAAGVAAAGPLAAGAATSLVVTPAGDDRTQGTQNNHASTK